MICEKCGEDKEDVEVCTDPFSLEIHELIIEMVLCKDCYQERKDDI